MKKLHDAFIKREFQLSEYLNEGFFDPFSLTIYLSNFERKDLSNSELDSLRLKITMVHELTHLKDFCSTSWGSEYLFELYRGIIAVLHNNPENFHIIYNAYRHIFDATLSSYYTLKNNFNVENEKLSITSGKKFTNNGELGTEPILFGVYQKGNDVCRMPFTPLALLEVRAIEKEWEFLNTILEEKASDELIVEAHIRRSKIKANIYDAALLEYHLCILLILDYYPSIDFSKALRIAGVVSKYCLDIYPFNKIDSIKIPTSISSERDNSFYIENNNIGWLYVVIITNAYENGVDLNETKDFDDLLRYSNLPTRTVVNQHLKDNLKMIQENSSVVEYANKLAINPFNLGLVLNSLGDQIILDYVNDEKTIPGIKRFDEVILFGDDDETTSFQAQIYYDCMDIEVRIKDFIKICL